MDRRSLLKITAALPFTESLFTASAADEAPAPFSRLRPGDPAWPSDEVWEELRRRLDGQLIKSFRHSPPASARHRRRPATKSSRSSGTRIISTTRPA